VDLLFEEDEEEDEEEEEEEEGNVWGRKGRVDSSLMRRMEHFEMQSLSLYFSTLTYIFYEFAYTISPLHEYARFP
jgi:hypothetical protein